MEFIIKIDASCFSDADVETVNAMRDGDLRDLMADALFAYRHFKLAQASKVRTEALRANDSETDYVKVARHADYHTNKANVAEVLRNGVLIAEVHRHDPKAVCDGPKFPTISTMTHCASDNRCVPVWDMYGTDCRSDATAIPSPL